MKYICLIVVYLVVVLAGCNGPRPDTNVTAAVSHVFDNYSDRGAAEPTDTDIVVQPTTQASSGAAATQPVSVSIDGTVIHAPPGASVHYKKHVDGGQAQTTEQRDSIATGSSLVTNGPKGDFVSQPSKTELPASSMTGPNGRSKTGGANSEAGGTSYVWDAILETMSSPAGITMLSVIGGLLIAGGVLMIVVEHMIGGLADWALFAMIEVAGIGMIALSIVIPQHPAMTLLFIATGAAAVIWYVFYWKKRTTAIIVAPAATLATSPAPSILKTAETDAAAMYANMKSAVQSAINDMRPKPPTV